jgi:hypothetical protein
MIFMRRIALPGLLLALTLLPGLGACCFAAAPSRITKAVSDSARTAIPNSVHPRARLATDLGPALATRKLEAMTLRFSLSDAQQTALDQLLADQQNPASPRYRQWLTPAQYAAQFGLGSADMAKITAWLTAQGFSITGVANTASFVSFSGTVAQAETAFQTSIRNLSSDGETHFANVTDAVVPTAFANVVMGITGLHDFRLKSRARIRTVTGLDPKYTAANGAHYIAPGDFYTIYDMNPLFTSAINGSGVTIAVMGQTDISLADVAAFRTAGGLSVNAPTVKLYGCDPGSYAAPNLSCSNPAPTSGDLGESQLDMEWAGAVAPSASILFVNSLDVIDVSLTQAIDNNLAPIVTISYGNCEAGWGTAELNTLNQLFKLANSMGITVLGPAGDDGATDCEATKATTAVYGLSVDFPASSPYVTGVGGTMFNEGAGTYWNAGNGTYAGSALSYIPEAAWNESSSYGSLASGGGGISAFFTKPTWQVTNLANDYSRDVPDLSLNAAAVHDGYLFCSAGSCTGGRYTGTNGTSVSSVGGTSVSTPAFAGMLALVEQKIGTRIGNANPTLYALANSTYYNNIFHDIVTGSNAQTCTTGTVNCPSGGTIGYSAGPGYDLATGWGTVDAYNMVNDWKLVTPLGIGTAGTNISVTNVAASAGSTAACGTVAVGGSSSFTATIASGVSGVTSTATGTVQFLLDNVAVGVPVALVGGSATATISTTGLAAGAHTVSASYSGDGNYAGSKGSAGLTIISATAPDFTLSPCSTTLTVASGKAAPGVVYTVTPVNGFTGSVYFSIATTSTVLGSTGSYSFTVTPVVISTTAAGTTTLDLYAYLTQARAAISQLKAANQPSTPRMPWYATGSGAAIAGLLLLTLPRRRRWGALIALLLSVAVIGGAAGCGSTANTLVAPTPVNVTPGSYAVTVTATYTNPTTNVVTNHNSAITFVVQ